MFKTFCKFQRLSKASVTQPLYGYLPADFVSAFYALSTLKISSLDILLTFLS